MKSVGVIGLGKMGHPIVRHLVAHGYEVAAHDLRPEAVDAAAKLGARCVKNQREVAELSELIIILVGFGNEVMDVLHGPDGVFAGAKHDAVIAVASTVAPETMKSIAADAQKAGKGLSILDVPLCRGEPAAEAGKLLLMAGGDEAAFERCRAVFSAFADDIFLLGGIGAGQVGKMVNNLLLWTAVCGNYEGFKLAAKLGVDPKLLHQALLRSSGNNWALEWGAATRPMPWAEKDMAIVMQEADAARVPLPVSGVIREVMKAIKLEIGDVTPSAKK